MEPVRPVAVSDHPEPSRRAGRSKVAPIPQRVKASSNSGSPVRRPMAACHPRRRLFRQGLCRGCFQLRVEPLELSQGLPPRIRDVEQRAVLSVPDRCPACAGLVSGKAPSAAEPALARRVACALCGWDAYLTSDMLVPSEPARRARVERLAETNPALAAPGPPRSLCGRCSLGR